MTLTPRIVLKVPLPAAFDVKDTEEVFESREVHHRYVVDYNDCLDDEWCVIHTWFNTLLNLYIYSVV